MREPKLSKSESQFADKMSADATEKTANIAAELPQKLQDYETYLSRIDHLYEKLGVEWNS